MAEVVVIGAGLGGLASALRLAKLGHSVTLVTRESEVGGALRPVSSEGFTWDATATTLPAALRDLSRKSGRALEREVELVPRPLLREYRFEDGSVLRLPGGSSAAQIEALDAALGASTGRAWVDYVHGLSDAWEVLRKHVLEHPYRAGDAPEATALLRRRTSLHKATRRLPDPRLTTMARFHALALGQDPRRLPAWWGVIDHLENNFGTWGAPTGLGPVIAALEARLATRKVSVQLDTEVIDVDVQDGAARGVLTLQGRIAADYVVAATDPHSLGVLKPYATRLPGTPFPRTSLLGLGPDAPQITDETVLYGDPTVVIRPGGSAPDGHQAWTVTLHGAGDADPVALLASRGVNVRQHVVVRKDVSPADQAMHFGSPYGALWQGPRTFHERLHTLTPIARLFMAGAPNTIAPITPFVALTGTQVAEAIGPA